MSSARRGLSGRKRVLTCRRHLNDKRLVVVLLDATRDTGPRLFAGTIKELCPSRRKDRAMGAFEYLLLFAAVILVD